MRIKALLDGEWFGSLKDTPETRRRPLDRQTPYGATLARDETGLPIAKQELPIEPGRYHLYVSYACPWAHRAILYRELLGLESMFTMTVMDPRWATPNGWSFDAATMSNEDKERSWHYLYEVYLADNSKATTRVTVPVLWDKIDCRIVCRESHDIMRLMSLTFVEA